MTFWSEPPADAGRCSQRGVSENAPVPSIAPVHRDRGVPSTPVQYTPQAHPADALPQGDPRRPASTPHSSLPADTAANAVAAPAAQHLQLRNPSPQRGIPARWWWLLAVAGVVVLVRWNIAAIIEEIQYARTRGQERAKAEIARTQLSQLAPRLDETSTVFRLIAQSTRPGVVHISAQRQRAVDEDAPARGLPGRRLQSTGQGSGFVVDADGYILTNYHVVEDAEEVTVQLSDRSTYAATIVGTDPATDLALLKINAPSLVPLHWGDSRELEVGDWVLAIGNPFGLERSVTAGIVSGKRRHRVVPGMTYQDFLQTDAAVNPGNSGGPLVNLRGEVVGVNSAIVGQLYQGISFAIPSELARDVYLRLRRDGQVARGWLGISMQELTPERAAQRNIPAEGVLVTQVLGRPAQEAGLLIDDVVLRWNGQVVHDPAHLALLVAHTEIGSRAIVTIRRDARVLEIPVTVGQRERGR
jgi:serine protease Do